MPLSVTNNYRNFISSKLNPDKCGVSTGNNKMTKHEQTIINFINDDGRTTEESQLSNNRRSKSSKSHVRQTSQAKR
jgi:hypothetical protein